MNFFQRVGFDGVAAFMLLIMWIGSIQRGNTLDFSAFVFAVFVWRCYHKLRATEPNKNV